MASLTTPLLVGVLLALFTAVQAWINKGRFDKQDERIDRLEERMDRLEGRIDRFEERVERRFEQLAADIAGMRSDLTQIALPLGLRARPETG